MNGTRDMTTGLRTACPISLKKPFLDVSFSQPALEAIFLLFTLCFLSNSSPFFREY